MENVEVKTSEEWDKLCLCRLEDRQGWWSDSYSIEWSWGTEKITRDEFEYRLKKSDHIRYTADDGSIWVNQSEDLDKGSSISNEELRTSNDWQKDCLLKVQDPNGWDRSTSDYSWYHEAITREEFGKRLKKSTSTDHRLGDESMWKDLKTDLDKPRFKDGRVEVVIEPPSPPNLNLYLCKIDFLDEEFYVAAASFDSAKNKLEDILHKANHLMRDESEVDSIDLVATGIITNEDSNDTTKPLVEYRKFLL